MQLMIDPAMLREPGPRKRVVAFTLACAVAGGLYGTLSPKWYRSTVVLAPAKTHKAGGLSSLLGGDMGGLVAGMDASLGGGADASRIAAVLKSAAVSDAVIEKFGLMQRYDQKYQESARDELWNHCDVRTQIKTNLVELSCEDQNPRFAQEMLGFFAEDGNRAFRRVSFSSATEEVRFLERRTAELRQQADDTAARLRQFQETHQIVDLDSQAKAVVSSVATLNSQRIAKQMELDYARSFSSGDEPGLRQLESQLFVVDNKLRDLEDRREQATPRGGALPGSKSRAPGMFPAALDVPQLRADYERLYRDRKVAEATLLFSLDRLEGARAAEARDVSTFVVMDPPTLPTRKTRPSGLANALLAAATGAILSLAFEYWKHDRNSRRRQTDDGA